MTFKPAHLLVALFAAAAIPAMAQNVAVVNGKPVPKAREDMMVKQLTQQGGQQDTPQLREKVKQELIDHEILVQEGDKLGLSTSAEAKAQLDLARRQIVIGALVTDFIKKHPVTDAEIQAEYDKSKAAAGDKEYRARHILVEKEDEAKAIIAKLKSGGKFEDLAKQSKDSGSAASGGDLDWASPANFVKPFSDAMVALKKGEMTETPVHTQFGYHVIKLDDIRPMKAPSLDELKPKISEFLQRKKLQDYLAELRKKAKIS
ncbi:peptidylprolyl isomerase [soil metagenome]